MNLSETGGPSFMLVRSNTSVREPWIDQHGEARQHPPSSVKCQGRVQGVRPLPLYGKPFPFSVTLSLVANRDLDPLTQWIRLALKCKGEHSIYTEGGGGKFHASS